MTEITPEEKNRLFEKLPQRLQDFLYSEDTGAFLLYLGQKYNLPDEQVSALSKIVGNIILKITPITSLAQEIANKVISDPQMAMTIAQELNSELITPALMPTPIVPATPTAPEAPAPIAPIPPTLAPAPAPRPSTDQYREPVNIAPEIIDLRKTPPPSPAEAGYGGQRPPVGREGGLPPGLPVAPAPMPAPRPAPPLTFTRQIEPPAVPLIEAEPHKAAPAPVMSPSTTLRASKVEPPPQYIMRPSGLPPTDFPRDVLDLRKDKGEF